MARVRRSQRRTRGLAYEVDGEGHQPQIEPQALPLQIEAIEPAAAVREPSDPQAGCKAPVEIAARNTILVSAYSTSMTVALFFLSLLARARKVENILTA